MKKLLMLLSLGMFLILLAGQVSAWEWDNVKSYDAETKTATITNALGLPNFLGGYEIATAKLETPHINLVGLGNQKIAQFTINPYQNYEEILKTMEFYDLNDGNKAVSKSFELKYLTYKSVEVNETICIDNKNIPCDRKVVGTHFEEQEVWNIFDGNVKSNEPIIIGVFMNVSVGDKFEWIPIIAGVKIQEWALVYQAVVFPTDTSVECTTKCGVRIGVNTTSKIVNVTKYATSPQTIVFVSVRNGTGINNGVIIGSATFSGNTATFSPPLDINTSYDYYIWSNLSGVNARIAPVTFPVYDNNIYVKNSARDTNEFGGQVEGISSIYTQTGTADASPTITLNAPDDASTSNNYAQTFNCTATDDVKVQNITLYLNNSVNQTNSSVFNNTLTTFSTSLAEGYYTWKCGACDNATTPTCVNGTARGLTISIGSPVVTLNSPINAYNSTNETIIFNCSVYDSYGVTNLSLYLNGVLNETNTSGFNNTAYIFSKNLNEGLNNWTCGASNINSKSTTAGTRNLTITTTPFIAFLTPPTLVNYANITQEYIPMKVNVSTLYFKNISYYLENVNSTAYTLFFTNETYDINFTDIPDAHYHYNVTICTTTNKCNTTETRHVNHDTFPPTLTLNSPLTNTTTLILPVGVILNFTATDEHLSYCWYEYGGTNTTFNCNTTAPTISVATSGAHSINYYSNDTFGNTASGTAPFYVYYVQPNATATNPITEGGLSSHVLFVNMTNIKSFGGTAYLVWNGTNKGFATLTNVSDDSIRFDKSFSAPYVNGTIVNWTWVYNVSGNPNVVNYNLTGNQTYIAMNITECGAGTYEVLNYTLYDQDTKALASTDNASIEVDLTLTSYVNTSQSWQYFTTKSSSTNLSVCLSSGTLNTSEYQLNAVAKYSYQDHVVQYHYIVDFNLTNATIPQRIKLYDLATSKSTSFLMNYQDENYLFVGDAIIDVWRRYIGDGVFFSVEHAKTDAQGQTRLHLVTEDIIYKFLVWKDGELVYTSPEYLALCQATPCQINLRKTISETDGLSERDNLVYSYEFNETTRTASFIFSTLDNTETAMNMTIYSSNQYANETACSTTLTTSGGQIDCAIPPAYANTSYQTIITRDGEYFGTAFNSLAPKSMDIFGYTGVILTMIAFLMLSLMAISSGVATIIFGIVGLAFMGLLQVFESGSIFGLGSAIIWLIVGGVIIIYKISQRRIQ